MSFKDLSPEQRKAMQAKAAETRRRKAGARKEVVPDTAAELPREHKTAAPVRDAGADPPALTQEDRDEIRRQALAQIEDELAAQRIKEREALMAAELEDELFRARVEAGLVTIDHRDDLITFVVDVAPFSDGLLIDGVRYAHGYEVTVPRRKYDSMRETMARTWDHEENAGYPNKKLMRPRGPVNTHNSTLPHAYQLPYQTTISERTAAVSGRPKIT